MRRKMLIEVSYTPEWSETKKEIRDEETHILNYIQESIGYDFHGSHGIKLKKYKFAPTLKDGKKVLH